MGATGSVLLAVPLLAAGCTEEPAFELRWRIADRPDLTTNPGATADVENAPRLLRALQCSEVGIERVRIDTRVVGGALNNALADTYEVPCFAPEFTSESGLVAGPTDLEPGSYRLELTGLDRKGDPWPCEDVDVAQGEDPQIVCPTATAEVEFTVSEGKTTLIDEAALGLAPPLPCEDGIDNDQDGLVDLADPACRRDLQANEDADTAASLFLISASFLNANPNFRCSTAGIGQIRARVFSASDELLATELATCDVQVDLPVFSLSLDAADGYRVEVDAIDAAEQPVTQAFVQEFNVTAQLGTFVDVDHDFGPAEFLEPLVTEASFLVGFLSSTGFRRFCEPPGSVGGNLVIEEIEFRVVDENMDPVDPTQWDIGTPLDVTNGTARIDCVNAPIFGPDPELTWGDYRVEARGLAGGEVCYETSEPGRLAPTTGQSSVAIDLLRVVDDNGMPSTACRDCDVDDDCAGSSVCEMGICSDQ